MQQQSVKKRSPTTMAGTTFRIALFVVANALVFSLLLRSPLSGHMSYLTDYYDTVVSKSIPEEITEATIPEKIKKKRRAFVCVTGVLERLELGNKAANLFEPLLEAGYELDVAFVLQTPPDERNARLFPPEREPYSFTATRGGHNDGSNRPGGAVVMPVVRNESTYVSDEQIIGFLKKKQGKGNYSRISVILREPIVNPPINLEYLHALVLREGFRDDNKLRKDDFEIALSRTVTHVRMLSTYNQCSQEMAKNTNGDYGVVVRVGEEAMVSEPIQVDNIGDLLRSTNSGRAMVAVPCQTTRGHSNDQIDFVSSEAGKDYFELPYASFYGEGIFDERTIHHVGRYLQYIYQSANITVLGQLHNETTDSEWKSLRPIVPVPASDPTPSNAASMKRKEASYLGHPPIPFPLSYNNFVDELTNNGTSTESIPPLYNNNTSAREEEEKKRALVCVTGQLARLDLENKIDTLIKPMQDVGYDVDVALVLSSGTPVFSAEKKPKNDTAATFTSAKQVWDLLKTRGFRVISEESTYVPNRNIPGNPEFVYQKAMDVIGLELRRQKSSGIGRAKFENILFKLVRANFVMVESYTRCWKDVVRSGVRYDLYVRARDDVGFLEPVKSSVFEPIPSRTLISSACRIWSGMNDRFAFVSPDSAECYFNLPFVRFYDGNPLGKNKRNTESYFRNVYVENKCAKVNASKELLPFLMRGGRVWAEDVAQPFCPKDTIIPGRAKETRI